jgi:hypothetical protein
VLVAIAMVAGPSAALAQVVTTTAPPAAPPPLTNSFNPLTEYTARTIGARQVKVGVLAIDLGVTDWLTIGTDPPAWALRAVGSVLVPNLHVEAGFLRTPFLQLSGRGAVYYADISTSKASGHLLTAPVSLLATVPIGARVFLHMEGAYNWVRGFGNGDESRAEIRGSVAARTAQVGAMVEVRLSRVVALLGRGRFQAHTSPLVLSGSGMPDAYTNVQVEAQVRALDEHPWMALGGVACTWKHVGFTAGAGYGNYFVPGLNIAIPSTGVVPEASLWAIF